MCLTNFVWIATFTVSVQKMQGPGNSHPVLVCVSR